MKLTSCLIALLLPFTLCTCSTVKKAEEKSDSVSTNIDSSRIVFVVLSITRDSASGRTDVKLLSTKQTAGKLKVQSSNQLRFENFLSIHIYSMGKLVDSVIEEHPLFKHIEFADENNEMQSRDVVRETADFFLRLQLKSGTNEIKIFESLKGQKQKELAIIPL